MSEQSVCQGCGVPVAQPAKGRRKWCSERCRKASYGGVCEGCGASTSGSNGRARAPQFCLTCHVAGLNAATRAASRLYDEDLVALWNAGATRSELAEVFGLTPKSISCRIARARARGHVVAYRRPDSIERARVLGKRARSVKR